MSSCAWLPWTETLKLSADTVHLVHIPLSADDEQIERLRSVLSPDELARADRFKVERARRHFIVCRGNLRQLLADCTNVSPKAITFEYGPHGKPGLPRQEGEPFHVEFSVSHSGDQALIAIAVNRCLGVDLEQIDKSVRILKLAERFFSPREASELRGLPESDQLPGFFRGWTCKEAYLKATGRGLSFSLSKFSVSLNPHEPARLCEVVDDPTELTRWRLLSLNLCPGYSAAILFEAHGQEAVTLHQWSRNS